MGEGTSDLSTSVQGRRASTGCTRPSGMPLSGVPGKCLEQRHEHTNPPLLRRIVDCQLSNTFDIGPCLLQQRRSGHGAHLRFANMEPASGNRQLHFVGMAHPLTRFEKLSPSHEHTDDGRCETDRPRPEHREDQSPGEEGDIFPWAHRSSLRHCRHRVGHSILSETQNAWIARSRRAKHDCGWSYAMVAAVAILLRTACG